VPSRATATAPAKGVGVPPAPFVVSASHRGRAAARRRPPARCTRPLRVL